MARARTATLFLTLLLLGGAGSLPVAGGSADSGRSSRVTAGIDVQALDLTLPASNVTAGTNVTPIVFRVRNAGDANATATQLNVAYRLAGGGASTTIVTRDLGAEGVTLNYTEFPFAWTFSWDTQAMAVPPGNYELVASATQAGDVDLSNNTILQPINLSAAPAPFLALSGLLIPDLWYSDDPGFTLSIDVTNTGTADLSWPAQAILEVRNATGGAVLGSASVTNLSTSSPGNQSTVTIGVDVSTFPDGSVTVFNISVQGLIDPTRQSVLAPPVTVERRKVDLLVTFVSVTPPAPIAGDLVRIAATVRNDGSLDAVLAQVQFQVDGVAVHVEPVNATKDGGSLTVQHDWQTNETDAGSRNITVTAGNGSRSRLVTIAPTPKANVYISGVQVSSIRRLLDPGDLQSVDVNVTVANNGTKGIVNGTVELLVDGSVVESNASVTIPRGGQVVVPFMIQVTTGENDTARAMVVGAVTSPDTAKGRYAWGITVPGDIDTPVPKLTSLRLTPATQQRTLDVNISVTVGNTGDGDAKDVNVEILDVPKVGTATTLRTLTVTVHPGLETTAAVNITIRETFALGNHSLRARIRGPPESSANATLEVIELQKPAFKIRFVDGDVTGKTTQGRNGKLSMKVHIDNTGTGDSGKVVVTLIDVGNPVKVAVTNQSFANIAKAGKLDLTFTVTIKAGIQHRYAAEVRTEAEFAGEHISAVTEKRITARMQVSPGFEMAVAVAAVAIAVLVLRRRDPRRP